MSLFVSVCFFSSISASAAESIRSTKQLLAWECIAAFPLSNLSAIQDFALYFLCLISCPIRAQLVEGDIYKGKNNIVIPLLTQLSVTQKNLCPPPLPDHRLMHTLCLGKFECSLSLFWLWVVTLCVLFNCSNIYPNNSCRKIDNNTSLLPSSYTRALSIVTDPNLHPHRVKGTSVTIATQLQSFFSSPLWCWHKKGKTKEIKQLQFTAWSGCWMFSIDCGPRRRLQLATTSVLMRYLWCQLNRRRKWSKQTFFKDT